MDLTNRQLKSKLNILNQLIETYKKSQIPLERDLVKYEQSYKNRLCDAISFFQKFIPKAIQLAKFSNASKIGRPEKLTLEQRVKILLIQKLVKRSNREMSNLLLLFSFFTNVDISYKTIERLYDDSRIEVVLFNMNSLINKELNLVQSDACGDGSGYVLSIKEHYRSIVQKIKDKKSTKKQKILFAFTILDLEKRIYIAYGISYKSEKEAYNKAIEMLKKTNIKLNSIRLDKYYSGQTLVKNLNFLFKGIKCYLIPKINATIKGSQQWKQMLRTFCETPMLYFKEYYKRNQSESGFSEDKRRFGWRIPQKIESRANMSYFSIFTWHNLLWIGK